MALYRWLYIDIFILGEVRTYEKAACTDEDDYLLHREDEKSRRYYADEAVKEIEEAIDDCKTLVNIDEAHHYFGMIGRPKIWKWAALPVIALVVLGVHVGDNLAAAFGCAYNVWVESLLAFAVMVAILIPAMFFVMRVLFQVLLLVRISSLEMLHGRIVGVKNNIYAEAEC